MDSESQPLTSRLNNSVRGGVKTIQFYSPVSKSLPGSRAKAIRAAVEGLTEKFSQKGKNLCSMLFQLIDGDVFEAGFETAERDLKGITDIG